MIDWRVVITHCSGGTAERLLHLVVFAFFFFLIDQYPPPPLTVYLFYF